MSSTRRDAPITGGRLVTEIYEYVVDRRPTRNPAWREQVRKVCQQHARRVGHGRYMLDTS